MKTRQQVAAALAAHYTREFGGPVSASYDEGKGAYCIEGSGLPASPELAAERPNGWSLLDYIKPSKAQAIANQDTGMATANYRTEFPHFGDLDVTLPDGFVDVSWHNDACPSFTRELPSGLEVVVYIDYADPAQREMPEWLRFGAHVQREYSDVIDGVGFSTDDWEVMVEWLTHVAPKATDPDKQAAFMVPVCMACRKPNVLKEVDASYKWNTNQQAWEVEEQEQVRYQCRDCGYLHDAVAMIPEADA